MSLPPIRTIMGRPTTLPAYLRVAQAITHSRGTCCTQHSTPTYSPASSSAMDASSMPFATGSAPAVRHTDTHTHVQPRRVGIRHGDVATALHAK